MTRDQITTWLLANGFEQTTKSQFKRGFLDLKIFEGNDGWYVRLEIYGDEQAELMMLHARMDAVMTFVNTGE